MLITIIAVVVGVIIGLLRGGKLQNLRGARVATWPVLLIGVVLQATAESFSVPGALSLSIIGMFMIVVGLALNSHLKGWFVAGFGVLLNLLVTVTNGHVPIRFEALQEAGIVGADVTRDQVTVGGLGEMETTDTTLAGLGDVIPLELFSTVISFGDLITLAGIIVITQNLIASRHRVGISVDELFGPETAPVVIDLGAPGPADEPLDLRVTSPSEPSIGADLDLTARETVPSPFEAAPSDQRPFDYGEADTFDDGIGAIRSTSR